MYKCEYSGKCGIYNCQHSQEHLKRYSGLFSCDGYCHVRLKMVECVPISLKEHMEKIQYFRNKYRGKMY